MSSRRPSILVVDDTPLNIQLLNSYLSKQYKVFVANSGRRALEILRNEDKPDLILLDIMMPEMDGHEVCRHIKQDASTSHIPVIFVSARNGVEDQQLSFDLGAVDYITKPFELPLVLARVAVHIQLKQKTELLEKLAFIDGLTNIFNRRALDDMVERECGRAIREGKPLAALLIDIDYFKPFNDNYGHGLGDNCLRSVAQTLQASLYRSGDFVARYGGEEFCVMLPDCDAKGARQIAEHLRSAIADLKIPHAYSSASEYITVSIGGTSCPIADEKTCFQNLLQGADAALYTAKGQGRNRVVLN